MLGFVDFYDFVVDVFVNFFCFFVVFDDFVGIYGVVVGVYVCIVFDEFEDGGDFWERCFLEVICEVCIVVRNGFFRFFFDICDFNIVWRFVDGVEGKGGCFVIVRSYCDCRVK